MSLHTVQAARDIGAGDVDAVRFGEGDVGGLSGSVSSLSFEVTDEPSDVGDVGDGCTIGLIVEPNHVNGRDTSCYNWGQTVSTVTVTFLPRHRAATGNGSPRRSCLRLLKRFKRLVGRQWSVGSDVRISRKSMDVVVDGHVVCEGVLFFAPVEEGVSTFSVSEELVDGKMSTVVRVVLQKADGDQWWPALLQGECPRIDTRMICSRQSQQEQAASDRLSWKVQRELLNNWLHGMEC